MARRLPPLGTLKSFEAAARHESFTRAAAELHVTPAAVSHQVKALEVSLGRKLFERERKRLVLTDAGREYLTVVQEALDRIALGTERLGKSRAAQILVVSATPDFAAKWLVPRLKAFSTSHPGIDLQVSATSKLIDFNDAHVDVAIRHGLGNWSGLDAVRLSSERLFPVCSPTLLSEHGGISQASDLLKFPLLRLEGWTNWAALFETAGVATREVRGPTINQASMLIDAAIEGQGVALARTALASWDLIHGRLVRPLELSMRMRNTYWIVSPKLTARERKVALFRTWALEEAARNAEQLSDLLRQGALPAVVTSRSQTRSRRTR